MKQEKLPGEDYRVDGQALIFYMPKELDHHVAKELCLQLDVLIESHVINELILDFKETEFMDSSGIGVIIGRGKNMQFRGGKICAKNMGKRVQMIFKSAGLERMVEVKEEK